MRSGFFAGAILWSLAASRLAFGWQTEVMNTPPQGRPLAIAVDSAGDLLTAGRVAGGRAAAHGIRGQLGGVDGA